MKKMNTNRTLKALMTLVLFLFVLVAAAGQKSHKKQQEANALKHIREILCRKIDHTSTARIYKRISEKNTLWAVPPCEMEAEDWMMQMGGWETNSEDSAVVSSLEPWMLENDDWGPVNLPKIAVREDSPQLEEWMMVPSALYQPQLALLEPWMTKIFR